MTNCNGCDAAWGGNSTCHCSGCHQTFSGLQAFDKHRGGSHAKRYCLDPESILTEKGKRVLALTNRAYPCWGAASDKPIFWSD